MRIGLFLFLFFFCLTATLLFPSNISNIPEKNVEPAYASYLKGLLSERYGDSQRALKEYVKAKKFDQESTSLSLRVAVQYIKLDKLTEALELLEDLKSAEPINLDTYLLLILLYSNQGNEDQANQEYEEMLTRLYKDKPDNLKIAESLAQFKLYKGELDIALGIYENILKINPQYTDAHFWIGYLYEETGQRVRAIEEWRKTLEFEPNNADALNSLGYIYAEEGINLDEAESLIKKALEINPDSPAYLDSLGWVYYRKEEFTKARQYIEKAAALLREPVILDHLGDVYYKLGEFGKAKESWQDVLVLEPGNEDVEEKINNITNEADKSKD